MPTDATTQAKEYPIIPGRFIRDISLCWGAIILTLAAAHFLGFGFWFYPILCLIIGNRQMTLLLLTHEAVHYTLVRDRRWNDWIGRYLCAIPVLISLKKYRRAHRFHHHSVGVADVDPDLHLYRDFPTSAYQFYWGILADLVTLRLFFKFLDYLTEWPEALSLKKTLQGRLLIFSKESDFISFNIVHLGLFSILYLTGHLTGYVIYWLIPLACAMHPAAILGAGLQHGPMSAYTPEGRSRTVTGPKWFMEIVLPLDINFHGEHHINPSVPHYWLKKYSQDLEQAGHGIVWKESYFAALRKLFRRPSSAYK